MKQRYNTLKLITKYISNKFARQMANSLMMSKINYNISIWGNTNKYNIKKINKIIEDPARLVIGKKAYGKTAEWTLKEIKWTKVETIYEQSVQKYIYKMLHSEDEHYIKYYWTKNRNIRNRSQNKVGHHDQIVGRSTITQGTILYAAVSIYNKLPKNPKICSRNGLKDII